MPDAARPPDPPPHPPAAGGYPPPPPYVPPGWSVPLWGAVQAGWGPPRTPAQVGSGRFRSMAVGELLDAIFSLYRRNFVLIAAISAVVQVPYAALRFVLFEVAGYANLTTATLNPFASAQQQPAITQGELQTLESVLSGVLVATAVLALVGVFIVLPLAEAATTRAVSDRYLDRDTSLGASYAAAFRRLGPLVVQSLILLAGAIGFTVFAVLVLVALVAVGGVAAAVLGVLALLALAAYGVFLYVRTSLAVPAVVLEGVSGWGGLVRSWRLTRGVGWRILGIRLLLILITAIIGGILSTLITLAGTSLDANGQFILNQVASAIVAVFIGPVTYIAVTLLYYDTRIRKEGFDIEMLARSL